DYIGIIGTSLLLLFGLITYLAIRFRVTFESFSKLFSIAKKDIKDEFVNNKDDEFAMTFDNNLSVEAEDIKSDFDLPVEVAEIHKEKIIVKDTTSSLKVNVIADEDDIELEEQEGLEMKVVTVKEELSETDNLANKLVADFGQFDPTLELGNYQFPPLDILTKYDSESITINQEELEENKNKIVDTLKNYNIGIASIKATIGPTVTLYEIVPDAGIRISKIKILEDDI